MDDPAVNKNAGVGPAIMTESKTAGEARLRFAIKSSKETNQIVPRIHPREARSKGHWGMSEWLSFFVPPFFRLEQ
jgi:hypothetical protein